MAKAAKAPAKKSSLPLLLGAGAAVILIVVMMPSGDSSKPGTGTPPPKKRSSKDTGQFTVADTDAMKNPFPSATVAAVDAFNPLIKKTIVPKGLVLAVNGGPSEIPTTLTGGEPNWYFTGCPATDGVREALFENTISGETVYVKTGEAFKAAHVQSIDVSSAVLVGPNGTSVNVPMIPYGEAPTGGGKKTAVAENGPLPVPTGAIGGPLPAAVGGPTTATLSNGTVIQLPANLGTGTANDLNVTPDSNNAGNGRRRRRNRNFGDSNNGL